MRKNMNLTDPGAAYCEKATCTWCGTVVSKHDKECPECNISFTDKDDEKPFTGFASIVGCWNAK